MTVATNRAVFAVLVLLLTLGLGAIAVADAIGAGFHAEGCRFAPDAERRASSAWEWLIVQAVILLPFGGLLMAISRVLQARLASIDNAMLWPIRAVPILGLATFAAWTLSTWAFASTCGQTGGLVGLLYSVRSVLNAMVVLLAAATIASICAGLIAGLSRAKP
jgi:hypothetical protein